MLLSQARRKIMMLCIAASMLLPSCGGEGSGSESGSSSSNDLTRAITCMIFPFFCNASSAKLNVPAQAQAVDLISVTGTSRDLSGNSIVAGYVLVQAAGDLDALVQKFDPAGDLLWARRFGSPDIEYVEQVQTGSDGTVVVMIVKHYAAEVYAGQTVKETYQLQLSADGHVVGISRVAEAPGR